ncbi:histidine kinase [Microbacterium sp. STN6]|uniref:sensor histidine kinase n=1 Tax=Microbacterium sp. STN6 TaxID=2995588 RepID=UPI002261019C|nr:ATP-binding protein [Microbacterium sp. STN6]MCX7521122.1 histidine kinase [Microbacterium sp. STN6]
MRIQKERDRLLAATSRNIGIIGTFAGILCLSLPGSLPLALYVISVLCLIAMGVLQWQLPRGHVRVKALGIWALGVGVVLLPIASGTTLNLAALCAIGIVSGAAVASIAIVLVSNTRHFSLLAALFAGDVVALLATQLLTDTLPLEPLALTLAGWIACIICGVWLGRMVTQTLRRIESASKAYQAERRASETEARRRQGARLLHDTVLATLTLLAHSGVGVSPDALRQQAADDAALLRQLRLGYTPAPAVSGDYKLQPVEESTLGNTLRSVKQKFERLGLEVNWHGTGHVLLPGDILDAFLLALAECLENVRRHAQVGQAHVTITDDDTTVRAMVTDAGVGFTLESVDSARLGFTESIVARLRDVGGNARLFSSPGSGTTVVLEVPK